MRLLFFFLFPLFVVGQHTGPWRALRPTKIRKNHIELRWEAVAGATAFDVQYKAVPDSFGYYDMDDPNNASGFLTPAVDCVNDTPAGGASAPTICITDSTAVLYGLQDDTRYRIRIKAQGATNNAYNTVWSYHLPVRTGLYPDEQTVDFEITDKDDMFRPSEPNQGDFTWWTNYWGNRERKVTDRTRDGNTRAIQMEYSKQQRTIKMSDGFEFLVPGEFGTTIKIRIDDDSYDKINPYYDVYPLLNLQTPGDTIFYDTDGTEDKLFRKRNGASELVYDSDGVADIGAGGPTRTGENRTSWDDRYTVLEVYKNGDQQNAWAQVIDLTTDTMIHEWNTGLEIGNGQIDVCPKGDHVIANTSSSSVDGAHVYVYTLDGTFLFDAEGAQAGSTNSADFFGHADNLISIQGHCGLLGRKFDELIFVPYEGPNQNVRLNVMAESDGIRNSEISHIGGQIYYNEGWALTNNHVAGIMSDPPSSLSRYWNKIWAVMIDESAHYRGENANYRMYANQHRDGTHNLSNNIISISYANATRTMDKVFANLWPNDGTVANYSEAYVIERNNLHGDEIPLLTGGGGGDVTPPSVNTITVDQISETSFRVDWTLDEASRGQVRFGTASGVYTGNTALESNFLTRHIQTVGANNPAPLTPNTTYYWQIYVEDAAGNSSYHTEQTTTTLGTQTPSSYIAKPTSKRFFSGGKRVKIVQ